ncbi:MAG TPA: YcgN family cysteine cluster protein [Novosphingobium sp.]|nr:YcgN family cysteine cluster protein [Novosphingobium sp.]HPZ45433.1 YcgN family cysteine cluster protein [Novosphingobium sp.]HQE00112.1 YcgN family cysteine cluster protein [Novosphingobium sp.]
MNSLRPRFWELPLDRLSKPEWEALCDGCGQCCLHKCEDEDTGDIYPTNVACRLLDIPSGRCSDYAGRKKIVPDCLKLTPRLALTTSWLPDTCAYRLRAEGEPLHEWHYLICGDREAVHAAGISVRGKAISELIAGPLEQHVILPPGMELADD